MWEWIFFQLNRQIKTISANGIEKDDIIGNICLYLCEHKEEAKKIYEEKSKSSLYRLIKHQMYEVRGQRIFRDKMEYSRYQRIANICKEYEIEEKKENAYKIYALLDNPDNFTIIGIQNILETAEPIRNGYTNRMQSLETIL